MTNNSHEIVKSASGKDISFQVVQDVYNTLTGKTERLSRMLSDPHQVSIADFENLHRAIEVATEQYDRQASHCSVVVRYCDGKSEHYSDFNRFKLQAPNQSRATESVDFEYEFLILLPKTHEAKSYSISFSLRSTAGVILRLRLHNATDAEKKMFYNFETGTARFNIDYIDLAVARSIEAQLEEWYSGLSRTANSSLRAYLKRSSRLVGFLTRFLTVMSACLLALYYFSPSVISLETHFRAAMLSFNSIFLANIASFPIANLARSFLERSGPYSIVLLSRADSELNSKFGNAMVLTLAKTVGTVLLGVAIGLATTFIAVKIGLQ